MRPLRFSTSLPGDQRSAFSQHRPLAGVLLLPLLLLTACSGGGSDDGVPAPIGGPRINDAVLKSGPPVFKALSPTNSAACEQLDEQCSNSLMPMPAQGDYWEYVKTSDTGSTLGAARLEATAVDADTNTVNMRFTDGETITQQQLEFQTNGVYRSESFGQISGPITAQNFTVSQRIYSFPCYSAGIPREARILLTEDADRDSALDARSITYTQTMQGYVRLPEFENASLVVHFVNRIERITERSLSGRSGTVEEEQVWLVPGMGVVKRETVTRDLTGRVVTPPATYVLSSLKLQGNIVFPPAP